MQEKSGFSEAAFLVHFFFKVQWCCGFSKRRIWDSKSGMLKMQGNQQSAAKEGESYAHECLGELYYRQGKYAAVYEQLKQVDELNCCGLYYLGKLYDEGHAVEQNTEKAIELYRKVVDSAEEVANIVGMDQHAVKAKKRLRSWE